MEVIIMESETFKELKMMIERNSMLTEILANREQDRVFTVDQAAEYLGVERRWVDSRKKAIGYFREGRLIRIKKSSIDNYLERYTIRERKR